MVRQWGRVAANWAALVFIMILSTPSLAQPVVDGWHWVASDQAQFPESLLNGMRCAHELQADTGIGLRPAEPANPAELFIYLQGGGSCYSAATCFGAGPGGNGEGAANVISGYRYSDFAAERMLTTYPFLRGADTQASPVWKNPFKRMNMVYIPYCTGDQHAGNRLSGWVDRAAGSQKVYFAGHTNFQRALAYLKQRYPAVRTVWMLGTSVGGGGANYNYAEVRHTFPGAQVHLIEDSSPGLPREDDATRYLNWGVEDPCNDCQGSPPPCVGCTAAQDIRLYNRSLDAKFLYGFLSFWVDPATQVNVSTHATVQRWMKQIDALAEEKSRTFWADNRNYRRGCKGKTHVVTRKTSPDELRVRVGDFLDQMVNAPATKWRNTTVPVTTCVGEAPPPQ